MSDYVLRLIPEQPDFVPSPGIIEKLKQTVAALSLDADEMVSKLENNVVFVDAGENWGKVICPVCKELLTDEWWSQAMGSAWETKFSNLLAQAACCNSTVSLNDLGYEWQVGFARFILEVRNPKKTLADTDQAILEEVIGCKLKRIDAYI